MVAVAPALEAVAPPFDQFALARGPSANGRDADDVSKSPLKDVAQSPLQPDSTPSLKPDSGPGSPARPLTTASPPQKVGLAFKPSPPKKVQLSTEEVYPTVKPCLGNLSPNPRSLHLKHLSPNPKP